MAASFPANAWLLSALTASYLALPALAADTSSLTTFTAFPTEPIGRLTSTVTTETHTVVTESGKPLTVPVLPNYEHGCYFCPKNVGGLVLSGFTHAGVYPAHSPTGFPSKFPEISVDAQGNPTFKPRQTSTQQLSKSTGTVSSSDPSKGNSTHQSTRSTGTLTHHSIQSIATGNNSSSGQRTSTLDSSQSTVTGVSSDSGSSTRQSTTSTKTKTNTGTGKSTSVAQSSNSIGTGINSSTGKGTSTQQSSQSHSASQSQSSGLTTYSVFPTQSVPTVSVTITRPSHTIITESGKPTTVPLLPDHAHGCWFCPTDAGGFELLGFTKPGVYPSGKPPGFSTAFPAITIGTNLDATFEKQSSTSLPVSQSTGSQRSTGPTSSKTTLSQSTKSSQSSSSERDPSTTTSSDSNLPIFSIFPTASVDPVTSIQINTASKTTETHDGHKTVFPVLPKFGHGKGLCWFCPHSRGGFVLSGFPRPGVYPTGNLPDFPGVIPKITIGNDLLPTFPSEDESNNPTNSASKTDTASKTKTSSQKSTTTTSCSKSVVSDCKTVTSFGVNTDGSTTTTHTTSSCTTRTGCQITGSTTNTATTSSATGGCWSYNYSFDNAAANDKRDDLDADGHRTLNRRVAAEPINKIGKCQLKSDANDPPLTYPAYPGATDLEKAHGALYWLVPTTTKPEGHDCPVVSMTKYPDLDHLTAGPVITGVAGGSGTYGTNPQKNPYVNVDHAYEKALVSSFFASILDAGVDCGAFNSFFMQKDPSHDGAYRLQIIYDQIAGNTNPDFVGMDGTINGIKGNLFNSKLRGLPNVNDKDPQVLVNKRLQLANQIAAIASLVNTGEVANLFKSTNSRIYSALLGIDELIQKSCNGAPVPKGGKWAEAYSTYMTGLFAAQNQQITYSINSLIKTVGNRDPPQLTPGVEAFNSFYPKADWGFKAGELLDWSGGSPIHIQKRDGDNACTRSVVTTTAGTSTPTAKSTNSASTGHQTTSTTRPTQTTSTSSQKPTSTSSSTTPSSTSTKASNTSTEKPTPTSNTPSSANSPTVSADGAPACVGNQIQGTCTQAHLPSQSPNSGPLSPVCLKVDSAQSPNKRINAGKAKDGASEYCSNLISNKVVLTAQDTTVKAGIVDDAAEGGGSVSFNILFDVGSCDPGTSADHQKVDFGAMSQETCYQNFFTTVETFCSQDETWGDYDPQYTIEGGVWVGGCGMWGMIGY